MKKKEFIEQLEKQLKKVERSDRKEIVTYYNELIDDRIDNGEKEEDIIISLGSIDMIIANLAEEKQVEVKPLNQEKKISTVKLVCLILLSPLIFALIVVLFSLLITIVCLAFSLVVSLVSIFASGIVYFFGSFVLMFDNFYLGLIQCGLSIILISLSVIASKYGFKLAVYLWQKMIAFLKFLTSKGGVLIYE